MKSGKKFKELKYKGTIILLGGSISKIIPSQKLKQYFNLIKLNNNFLKCEKGDSFIEIFCSKCGWKNIYQTFRQIKGKGPILGIGFVGSINKEILPGEIIIPIKGEHKIFNGAPNKSLILKLKRYLRDIVKIPKFGKIYSVDSIKEESLDLIKYLEKNHFLGIDMESAFFLSKKNHCLRRKAVVLVVSDNLKISKLQFKKEGGDLPISSNTQKNAQKVIISVCKLLLN